MFDRKTAALSFASAGVLAGVTLFVFGTLRDYGPESTIRRFHQLYLAKDVSGLQQTLKQDVRSSTANILFQQLSEVYGPGSQTPRVARMDRQYNKVNALVAYHLPGGSISAVMWIVVKEDRAWRIDAKATLLATRQMSQATRSEKE